MGRNKEHSWALASTSSRAGSSPRRAAIGRAWKTPAIALAERAPDELAKGVDRQREAANAEASRRRADEWRAALRRYPLRFASSRMRTTKLTTPSADKITLRTPKRDVLSRVAGGDLIGDLRDIPIFGSPK